MTTINPGDVTVAILSDIHHAGPIEQARGEDYEFRNIDNPVLRVLDRTYRYLIWMRHPLAQGRQLDRFLAEVGPADYVVANGDYPCDNAYGGASDPGSFQSMKECLGKLRARFGDRVRFTLGDHDLGKLTLCGRKGGMRLASWQAATQQLGLQPFWQLPIGRYLLLGVASPLIALPANQADVPPDEWPAWQPLREAHLAEIRAAFDALAPDQRVLLFCHDPTALPFLGREESVRRRLPQVEQTIIGHLHTNLIVWKSRVLSGIPPIRFLGRNIARFSSALHEAHYWWQFRVRLCPALSGIQLLNDGGYYTAHLDPAAARPAQFIFQPLPRRKIVES
jgi:hypothetical protein